MATRIAIEDAVSDHSGVDSLSGAACTSDAQCDPSHGSICARRFKAASGRCSPTWFGLCHAWADYGGGVDQWGNGDNIVAKFTPNDRSTRSTTGRGLASELPPIQWGRRPVPAAPASRGRRTRG